MKQYIGRRFVIRKEFDAIAQASVFLKKVVSKGPFTVNKVYGTGDDVGITEIIDFDGVYHRAHEGAFKDWWCLFRDGEFESKCKEYLEPEVESNSLVLDKTDKYFVVTYPETNQEKVSYYGPFDHESAKRYALAKKRTDNIFVGIAKLISEVKLSVEITDY